MAVDITSAFHESVRRRRAALGQPTPSHEILPKPRERSAFGEEARRTLSKIHSTAQFLHDSHEAYIVQEGMHGGGMTEAERDKVDVETQRFLHICGDRIEGLKEKAAAEAADCSMQLATHRQATLQLLYDQLKRVASLFDEQRGHRLHQMAEARDHRLGASAKEAGSFAHGGSLASGTPGKPLDPSMGLSRLGGALAGTRMNAGDTEPTFNLEWADDEVLEDEVLEESEVAQLQQENDALRKELETMVEQGAPRNSHSMSRPVWL